MNFLKKVFSWGYYRILFPLYEALVGKGRRKRVVRKKYCIRRGIQNVVIFGTPNHGNLGDYAIYEAEKKMFCRFLPVSNVFGVNMTDFQHELGVLRELLKKEDLLVLTGGGNLGNQYMDDEKIRREVILAFPDNRIVLFPQTLYFTPDAEGRQEWQKTVVIYNAHKDLHLSARDVASFHAMQEKLAVPIVLLPDVVLTGESLPATDKNGALLVLRNDVESVLGKKEKQQIFDMLQAEYGSVEVTDTEIETDGNEESLKQCLQEKLQQFNKAELVVTDRLHGMIFAALAQTPCVVLNNYNHKLKETYRWIQHLDYIEFLDDRRKLPEVVERLKHKQNGKFDNREILEQYQKFLREIVNG